MKTIYLFIFLFTCIIQGEKTFAQSELSPPEDLRVQRIIEQLERFYTEFSQDKVFLHLDKDHYSIDEPIWYKAYLVNGTSHVPEELSTNLYVEISNSDKKVIQMQRLKVNDGFAHGDMSLPDTLKEGFYHIRAYTAWMNNFDESLIPVYTVYVSNPNYQRYITREKLRINKRTNRKNRKKEQLTQLLFYPEGGLFVANLENTLGFKAVDGLGIGVDVKGSIYSKDDDKVADFESFHRGIGRVTFKPEKAGYFARIEGSDIKYDLPEVIQQGSIFSVDNSNEEKLRVQLRSNRLLSNDPNATDVIFVAHSRGSVKFHQVFSLHDAPLQFTIDKKIIPAGILHLTMFNGRGLPLGERLVFVDNSQDYIHYEIQQNMSESFYNKATFDIYAKNHLGEPVTTNFSLAVIPEFDNNSDPFSASILSTLLLTSDVKGNIEDPEYYFGNNSGAKTALDNLLLTQGWRRFSWLDIVENNFPEILNERERGVALVGQITREFFGIPFPNAKVELVITDEYNDIYTTYADDKGYFRFDNLNYPDTIHIQINAYKPNGKRNVLINLQEGSLPDVDLPKENYDRYITDKAAPEYKVLTRLEEEGKIEPIDYRPEKEKDPGYHRIHGNPDHVITADQIPTGYSNLFQVLVGRVPGVRVNGQSVTIRGPSSIILSNEPLYLVDGVPTDANGIASINPMDVDRIEILSGPSSAIYGSRGANGVIAVYTKRGEYMKKGFLEFSMLGYYSSREFYQPRFSTYPSLEAFKAASPTIYWQPNITTNELGVAKVSFRIPEFEFKMKLSVEGISYTGKPGKGNYSLILR